MSPAAAPVDVIVRAFSTLNAPGSRCSQRGKLGFVQSALDVQGCGGGPSKLGLMLPQNPQKTNCAPVETFVCAVVLSAKGIGRMPMKGFDGGGQSWLVGEDSPSSPLPGAQSWPA